MVQLIETEDKHMKGHLLWNQVLSITASNLLLVTVLKKDPMLLSSINNLFHFYP